MASSPTQQEMEKAYSQYELGLMYYNGTGGVQKDLNQALIWIKKAAIGGSSEAQSWLTRLEDPLLKDMTRTKMLKNGQIIEAYQAGLIDKDTAELYLKKQAIDNATRAASDRQQQDELARQQSENYQTVTNGLNGLTNQLNNMNNQMRQRNNSYQGFDASKGLNFKGYGY